MMKNLFSLVFVGVILLSWIGLAESYDSFYHGAYEIQAKINKKDGSPCAFCTVKLSCETVWGKKYAKGEFNVGKSGNISGMKMFRDPRNGFSVNTIRVIDNKGEIMVFHEPYTPSEDEVILMEINGENISISTSRNASYNEEAW